MTDTTDPSPTLAETTQRYSAFSCDDGLIVYDRTDHAAWLQSDTTVDLEEMV